MVSQAEALVVPQAGTSESGLPVEMPTVCARTTVAPSRAAVRSPSRMRKKVG